jgi:hypothetical protein
MPRKTYHRTRLQGHRELPPNHGRDVRVSRDDRSELRTSDGRLPASAASENDRAELRPASDDGRDVRVPASTRPERRRTDHGAQLSLI